MTQKISAMIELRLIYVFVFLSSLFYLFVLDDHELMIVIQQHVNIIRSLLF